MSRPTHHFTPIARPEISVILVGFREADRLLRALASIAACRPTGPAHEVVVVLNGVSAEFRRRVESAVEGVVWVPSDVNRGFAGALALGSRAARGELLVVCQDDIEVQVGWLAALRDTFDRFPNTGAVGSLILDRDGRVQTAGSFLFADATTTPAFAPDDPPDPTTLIEPRIVDYCGLSSLMISRRAWDLVDGADQGLYPVYYVDADLCTAVWSAGLVVRCQPASRITHAQGASSTSHFQRFLTLRHREIVRRRWADELATREPAVETVTAEVIERAAERARRRAVDRPESPVAVDRPGRLGASVELDDAHFRDRARSTDRDFVAWLQDEVDRLSARVAEVSRIERSAAGYVRSLEADLASAVAENRRAAEYARDLERRLAARSVAPTADD